MLHVSKFFQYLLQEGSSCVRLGVKRLSSLAKKGVENIWERTNHLQAASLKRKKNKCLMSVTTSRTLGNRAKEADSQSLG